MSFPIWLKGPCAAAVVAVAAADAPAQYSPRQQAAINVSETYSRDTLRMSSFRATSARQDGTQVVAVCSRTVTVRGQTTTTRFEVTFTIAALPPPRGQTVGKLYVARVTSVTLP